MFLWRRSLNAILKSLLKILRSKSENKYEIIIFSKEIFFLKKYSSKKLFFHEKVSIFSKGIFNEIGGRKICRC